MAQATKFVVQVERLRDQVYQLIRDDLKSGDFAPGQRLTEVDLAERYRVSRTPIREALFQLSRDGLLAETERGYMAPNYSLKELFDRLEVKRLLSPKVAEHIAATVTLQQIRQLTKSLEQEKAANEAGNIRAFGDANNQFRSQYYSICENELLARCAQQVDDQVSMVRKRIHDVPENRMLSIEHDGRLLAAIIAHDKLAAVAEIERFLDFLATYYSKNFMNV